MRPVFLLLALVLFVWAAPAGAGLSIQGADPEQGEAPGRETRGAAVHLLGVFCSGPRERLEWTSFNGRGGFAWGRGPAEQEVFNGQGTYRLLGQGVYLWPKGGRLVRARVSQRDDRGLVNALRFRGGEYSKDNCRRRRTWLVNP